VPALQAEWGGGFRLGPVGGFQVPWNGREWLDAKRRYVPFQRARGWRGRPALCSGPTLGLSPLLDWPRTACRSPGLSHAGRRSAPPSSSRRPAVRLTGAATGLARLGAGGAAVDARRASPAGAAGGGSAPYVARVTVLALLSYFVLPTVVTAAATAVVTAVVVRRMFERRMIAFGDQIEALVAEVRTSRGEQQDVGDQQQDVLDHDPHARYRRRSVH